MNLSPLVDLISLSDAPTTLIDLGDGGGLLDNVYYADAAIQFENNSIHAEILFVIPQEISFSFFGVDTLQLVIGGTGEITSFRGEATTQINEHTPVFSIRLSDIVLSLRIDTELLRPVNPDTLEPDPEADGLTIPFGNVGLEISSDEGFFFEFDSVITIPPFMIGESGVVVEANNVIPIFSDDRPEEVPGFIPEGAKGIFIDGATIYLPPDLGVAVPSDIQLDDFFIGSGGFSGKITGNWTPQLNADRTAFTGNGAGDIFGIPVALKQINLEFKQNTFVESSIRALMILPFFDQPVDCQIGLANDGDFFVALSAAQDLPPGVPAPQSTSDGLFVFTKQDLLELTLKSIAFDKKGDLFSIQLGGDIKPLFGGINWPEVEIKALTIDSEGNVKVEGGWLEIPKQAALDFHGFKLELTKIGFGREDDGSRWIGLSGGINIVEGIPLKGGVEGLKIIWKDTNDIRLEISGINVAFEIEDVLKLDGMVFFIDEPTKKGFKGGVKMIIYPLDGMMIDVQFIAGRNIAAPPFNFFYIYMGLELPVGIPLGNTGAALFGMAGLFGYNMTTNKGLPPYDPNEAWFENDDGSPGFYKRGTPGVTTVDKWTDMRESLAFGAGLSLGTASDNGFTFSGKVLLIVLIPGPMILVEGKAQFLKERGSLDDEPIFRMLAVLDGRAGTFLMNVEAKYKYPEDTGRVIDIIGGAETFFNFNNPNAWHFYLGQESPASKRIRAKILNLFNANSYFMMEANRVGMGVWAGYDKTKKYGPLKVILKAAIGGTLDLGRKPPQAAGTLILDGDVRLKACGKSVGLTIVASLKAKTPTPWYIYAKFKVKLRIPLAPDPKATVKLKWESDVAPPWPMPLAKVGIEHLKVTEKWDMGKYPNYDPNSDGFWDGGSGSSGPSSPWVNSPIVPLDARPVLTFSRPVNDMTDADHPIGVNSQSAPPNDRVGDYEYKYRVKRIVLMKQSKSATSSSWVENASSDVPATGYDYDNPTLPYPIYGSWQVVTGSADGGGANPPNVKLMLWVNTAFAISRELESNDAWLITNTPQLIDYKSKPPSKYPCALRADYVENCNHFLNLEVGATYSPLLLNSEFLYVTENGNMEVASKRVRCQIGENAVLYNQTLKIIGTEKVQIVLPDNMVQANLWLSNGSKGKIRLFDNTNNRVNKRLIRFDLSGRTDEVVEPILLMAEYLPFRAIEIDIETPIQIIHICALTEEDYDRKINSQYVTTYTRNALVETWGKHTAALLEPNCYYNITVETEVKRRKDGRSWSTQSYIENSYFQTANPPGAFTLPENESTEPEIDTDHYPYGGPLKDPSVYIKHTIPGKIASDETQVAQVQQVASNEPHMPVYRSHDVGIKFKEAQGFIEQMYLMANLPLTVRLFDNNDQPVLDVNGNEVVLENQWSENPEPIHTREETQWRSYLAESGCEYKIDEMQDVQSESLYAGSKALVLKPRTLYKARLFGGNYDLYQFSFVTSKYCTFIHHVHSFADAVWDHSRLLDNPASPMLDSGGITELGNILSGLNERSLYEPQHYEPEQESVKFEQLMELFKLGIRQLPEQVEMMLLNDRNQSYGLLLESPEPIDWERVVLWVKHNANNEVIEESVSSIKIIEANVDARSGGGTNYNEEWVDILLLEQLDISTLKIEHRRISDTGFSEYFQFGDEGVFPAGTVIRIHSGKEADHSDPSVEIEHRYRLTETDTGAWQFDAQGEIIQIVDGTGKVLHNRSLIPHSNGGKDIIVIRNKDQTGAFIFFPDEREKYSDLPDGRYCFGFKFMRKIKDKPVLKRMGLESDEETSIEFSLPTFIPEE